MSDIVLIMGYPASGKSTLAKQHSKNRTVFNRDTIGGKVSTIPQLIKEAHAKGERSFLVDNTYPTIESRAGIIEVGKKLGLPVHCKWMTTSIEDAQYNAVKRQIERYGKMLDPDELKEKGKTDPNMFPPAAQFTYRKLIEGDKKKGIPKQTPSTDHGFTSVEEVKFVRELDKTKLKHKAIIFDLDGTLRTSKAGNKYPIVKEDIQIIPGTVDKVKKLRADGFKLFALSNQSGVHSGKITYDEVEALCKYTLEPFGGMWFKFCPHRPMVSCYCRKPMPGVGVELMEKFGIDPNQTTMVGDMKSDETFAKRCGFNFEYAERFFSI